MVMSLIRVDQIIFASILFQSLCTNTWTRDAELIAENRELYLKKIAVFNKVTSFLIKPVNKATLEQQTDNEEILMGVMFTRYYHFWSMLSLYTCSMYYSKEGPQPNEQRSSVCKRWANLMYDHLSESKGDYFNFSRSIMDKEIGTTFSLRKISSRLQLLEGYAKKMKDIFSRTASKNVFDSMRKSTKNLETKDGKSIPINKKIPLEETAREYYKELWRRMITFYGDNLILIETYYNSVLVDDKDVVFEDLIPSMEECINFWLYVPTTFPKLDTPEERTFHLQHLVKVNEQYRMFLHEAYIPEKLLEDAQYLLETQPSGVSEYVVLLEAESDNENTSTNGSLKSAYSSFSDEMVAVISDSNDEISEIVEVHK